MARVTLNIPDAVHQHAQRMAENNGVSLGDYLAHLLEVGTAHDSEPQSNPTAELVSALSALIAMNNCNYDRGTDAYENAMNQARAALANVNGNHPAGMATRLTRADREIMDEIGSSVWDHVFHLVDSYEYFNGDEAGAIAQAAASAVETLVRPHLAMDTFAPIVG